MAGQLRYTLKYPIRTIALGPQGEREETITELVFAPRVKGRHMRAMDAAEGPIGQKLALIAALAGITPREADELDQDDLMAIGVVLDSVEGGGTISGGPLVYGRETGPASSPT